MTKSFTSTLTVPQSDLTSTCPSRTGARRVRDVISHGVDPGFDVLRATYEEEPTNWSRRYKANPEKIACGDVYRVTEVIRDLWRRDRTWLLRR